MNIVELYSQTPVARHSEIVVSDNRLFFEGEEFVIEGDGELRLIRSDKERKQDIKAIKEKLGIKEAGT